MDIEQWLPTDIMLALTFFLSFSLEIVRYFRLRTFHLNLTWTGGWRYAYYLPRLALTAGLGPGLATVSTWGLTLLWRYLQTLPSSHNLYTGGLLWLASTGGEAGLLFAAWYKARGAMEKVIKPWLFWTVLASLCFVLEPLRWIFGGTLVLLVTSAVGQKVRFTGWQDLVDWVRRPSEEASSQGTPVQRLAERLYRPRRIRIVALTETEGYLSRSGEDEIEVEEVSAAPGKEASATPGEEALAAPGKETSAAPGEKAARFILDAGRLANLVEAVQEVEARADLLEKLPRLIAENAEKIAEYKKQVGRGEGTAEEKLRQVEEFIRREVFEAAGFGERMRSLLYWHYDLPGEKVRVSISPVPRVRLVPLLSWAEYFGLFLGKESAEPVGQKSRRK